MSDAGAQVLESLGALTVLIVIAQVFAGAQAATVFHELGHLLAGRAVGFEVISLEAGAVTWKPGKGVKIMWRKAFGAGLVRARITRWSRLRMRMVVFSAGGPAASLAATLVFAVAAAAAGPTVLGVALVSQAFVNLANAAFTLVPLRRTPFGGKVTSDGHKILRFWAGDEASVRETRKNALLALIMTGKAGLVPAGDATLAAEAARDAPAGVFNLFLFLRAVETGARAEALQRLTSALADPKIAGYHSDFLLHGIAVEALRHGNQGAAETLRRAAEMIFPAGHGYRDLADAALAKGRGDAAGVAAGLAAWRAFAARQDDPAYAAGGVQWILAALAQ